ncbi:MAG: phytanoyl-CoA dioxygenase family protein [Phycisphaeraceae bacterium]
MSNTNFFVDQKLTDQQLKQYRDDGFLRLGRILTDTGLEQMRASVMNAWEAEKGPFDPSATWLKNSLLVDIHKQSDIVRSYYLNGPLVDVAESLIGSNLKGVTSQLTFKMRGNTSPFAWHQDNGYGELDPYNALTTLTALDDADEQNGCLWILPGSHKMGQIERLSKKQKDEQVSLDTRPEDESKAIPVPMKAGEAVCFHCHTLHKSEGNRSTTRDRRIVFLRYADADAVEVYNDRQVRLGPLIRGVSQYEQIEPYTVPS